MIEYKESGFCVSLSQDNSFRFCDMKPYKKLSGRNLKEMDFGWWDESKKTLFLMEIKGHRVWENSSDNKYSHLIKGLVKKAQDSMLILSSVWSGTKTGKEFSKCLPDSVKIFSENGKIDIVFLIYTPVKQKALLGPLKDKINNELFGVLSLFDIKRAKLVDQDIAAKYGLPVK